MLYFAVVLLAMNAVANVLSAVLAFYEHKFVSVGCQLMAALGGILASAAVWQVAP